MNTNSIRSATYISSSIHYTTTGYVNLTDLTAALGRCPRRFLAMKRTAKCLNELREVYLPGVPLMMEMNHGRQVSTQIWVDVFVAAEFTSRASGELHLWFQREIYLPVTVGPAFLSRVAGHEVEGGAR